MNIRAKDLRPFKRRKPVSAKVERSRQEAARRFEREALASIGVALEITLKVRVSDQALADLNQLVAYGLFGLDIADCAQRFIYEGLRQKAAEGWLAMPALITPKPKKRTARPTRDFVGELVAERSKTNPRFPKMVAAAKKRRSRQ